MLDYVIAYLILNELLLRGYIPAESFLQCVVVLHGDHDRLYVAWITLGVILHGDLALSVRAYPRDFPTSYYHVQASAYSLGQGRGERE